MTALELEILLHYYYHTDDFREGDFSAPAVRAAIDRFCDVDGLLFTNDKNNDQSYRLTMRGDVFVKALLDVPLPVQSWVMPSQEKCGYDNGT